MVTCLVFVFKSRIDHPLALPGYVIESHGLVVDEASLTGESDPVKKGHPPKEEPWVRSGTQVGLHWSEGGHWPSMLGKAGF